MRSTVYAFPAVVLCKDVTHVVIRVTQLQNCLIRQGHTKIAAKVETISEENYVTGPVWYYKREFYYHEQQTIICEYLPVKASTI